MNHHHQEQAGARSGGKGACRAAPCCAGGGGCSCCAGGNNYGDLKRKMPLLLIKRRARAHFDSAEYFLHKEGKAHCLADSVLLLPPAHDCSAAPLPMKLDRTDMGSARPSRPRYSSG